MEDPCLQPGFNDLTIEDQWSLTLKTGEVLMLLASVVHKSFTMGVESRLDSKSFYFW